MYDWINTLGAMEVQQLMAINDALTIAAIILTAFMAFCFFFSLDDYDAPSKFIAVLMVASIGLAFYVPNDEVLAMASNYKAPVPQANMSHMVRMIHVR